MNVERAREYCLNKKGTIECLPFDDVSLVIKVMGKMFALIDLESANTIALKCDPEYALELRERYTAIEAIQLSTGLIISIRNIGTVSALTRMQTIV